MENRILEYNVVVKQVHIIFDILMYSTSMLYYIHIYYMYTLSSFRLYTWVAIPLPQDQP
jgi:hypothetical protein